MESVSAQDQENANRRTKLGSRAGSVPPRATTPVTGASQAYVPGTKTGVVTPAVRTAGSMGSQSVPNKRQRVGDSHSGSYVNSGAGQRAPLGAYRGGNMTGTRRPASPTKIPTKTGSLKRVPVAMPIPKPGTHHHMLGHGRLPVGDPAAIAAYPTRSVSSSSLNYGRYANGSTIAGTTARRSLRAKRESFKPRPSLDKLPLAVGRPKASGRWTGGYRSTTSVREEYEGDY